MKMSTMFALSPAITIDGIIDIKENTGQSIFQCSTERIDEELYDCRPNGMNQFIQSLAVRACEYGWDHHNNGIVHIQEDPSDTIS